MDFRKDVSVTDQRRFAALSERERQCLRLVFGHMGSKEIARELGLSAHTVDGHLRTALRKLELPSRRDAARWLAAVEPPPQRLTTEPVSIASTRTAAASLPMQSAVGEAGTQASLALHDSMSVDRSWRYTTGITSSADDSSSHEGVGHELETSQVIPWIIRAMLLTLGVVVLTVTGFEALNRVVFAFLRSHS